MAYPRRSSDSARVGGDLSKVGPAVGARGPGQGPAHEVDGIDGLVAHRPPSLVVVCTTTVVGVRSSSWAQRLALVSGR